MTFTIRLFLSKLSTTQMNAALGGGTMSFLMLTFFIGLIGYSTALIGQYYGSGQRRKCPVVVSQAAIIAVIAYPLILLVAAPLARSVFKSSGIAPEQLAPQIIYFNILVYAVIIGLMRTVFSCFFSGIGRTRVVMIASVITMLVNVGAEYVLIFGHYGFPALGIKGAAYGTIVGGICGLSVLIAAYFIRENRYEYGIRESFRFDSGVMGKLLKLGYPAGLEFFLAFAAFAAMIMLFQSQGQLVATAASVTFNWDMVAYVPLIGIEIAVTSLVGRYMGARCPDRAHNSAMSGLKIGSIYSGIMLVMFAAFPGLLVNVFRPDTNGALFAEALPLTVFMVRFMSVYVLLEAMMVAFCGALRGAGDTFWAMCMSVSLHWLMVGIIFVMLKVMHTSAQAAWVAMILWFFGLSFVFVLRYRGGKWRSIEVVHDTELCENTAS
jgi:MATE family multidrug resistance protein